MAASTGDKITDTRNAARPNSTKVSAPRAAGGTTLSCDNLAGWPTASKVHFVTYQIDSSSDPVPGTQLDCYGIVSGNDIGSFHVVDGTDVGNSINDVVEMLPTAAWGQDLSDALMSQHTRTGAHAGITATSLAATGNGSFGGNLSVTGTTTLTGATTIAALSNPYKFRVHRAAAQNTSAATPVKLLFDTKDFDTNSNFDSATNFRYTVPVNGFFHFNAHVNHNASSQGILYLYKNGSIVTEGNHFNTGVNTQGMEVSDTLQLIAGDYMEVFIYTDNTVPMDVSAGLWPRFSGFLISQT